MTVCRGCLDVRLNRWLPRLNPAPRAKLERTGGAVTDGGRSRGRDADGTYAHAAAARSGVRHVVAALRRDALAAGISPATIERRSRPSSRSRSCSNAIGQAEFTLTLAVPRAPPDAGALRRARERSAEQRLLARVERAHEVRRIVLVSVWALESNFGRFAGVRPTVPVLATLAYDGRRAALFRRELSTRCASSTAATSSSKSQGVVGRRHGPAAVPAVELSQVRAGLRRGRPPRHLDVAARVFASIAIYMASNGWLTASRGAAG